MAEFQLLRPWWLLALVPVVLVVWALVRRSDPRQVWRGVVAEHLLPFLVRDGGRDGRRRRALPAWALSAALALAVVAAAGPSFGRAASPFTQDESVLVVVLSARPSMDARDVQPSRLERAVQKLDGLFERRSDVRAGLIAYAGSAHAVVPPTRDVEVVRQLAAELSSSLMPVTTGDAAGDALALAREWIEAAGGAGSVLWITDSCDVPDDVLRGGASASRPPVVVYGVAGGPDARALPGGPAAAPLDVDALERAAAAVGGRVVIVTPDAGDVERLDDAVGRALRAAPGVGAEPRDDGYWFAVVAALVALLWSRRGWALPWA